MNPQLQLMLQQAIEAFQCGNFDSANLLLKRVLQVDSKNLPALHVLGLIKASQAHYKEAADFLGRAARINPNDASIQYNLAKTLSDSGCDKEALVHHKKAVTLAPNNPEAWVNYGKTASNLGRYKDALVCYSHALSLKSDYAEAALNKGATLKELKRYEEAINFAGEALAINPNLAEAWSNKGVALKELKRFDEAIAHYDKALSLQPDYHEAWTNKGVTLHELKRFDEAIAHYDKALSLQPDYHEAWTNKGVTLHELKRFDEAIAHYDKALSLQPDYHEASWNKSLSLLLQGDFQNGLPLYESRWAIKELAKIVETKSFEVPTWLGVESLEGKSILLYGEQGLGDCIQFSRYAKLVSNLGAKVILETPEPLANLMQNLAGVSQLVIKGEDFPPFDYQCPLLSLPLALGTSVSNIPMGDPYLTSHPNRVAEWNLALGEKRKKRIGLAWSSLSGFKDDSKRSLRLSDFVSALPVEGFEYICLQKELKECDRVFFESYKNIRFVGDELRDFADTAALIDSLDLVISTCTSVPHLSGALGKETWLLLSHVPDWRWFLDRADSPWYASIKLYRQSRIGDWALPLQTIREDLLKLIS